MKKLILGSSSPRRRQMFEWLQIPHELRSSKIEETVKEGLSPSQIVIDLANQKTQDTFQSQKNEVLVTADTIVVFENQILGKPKDRNDAKRMLTMMSGRSHEVYTGVSITFEDLDKNKVQESFFEVTSVKFANLDSNFLEAYLDTNDSLDKAGAYGLQSAGQVFVEKVEGSYSNVVGFPMSSFIVKMTEIANSYFKHENHWIKMFK